MKKYSSATESQHTNQGSAIIDKIRSKVKLKTAVIVFLIALLALVTATYSWFTLNTFSAVNSLDMTIGTGAQLLVSIENHGTDLSKYSKEITNEMIDEYLEQYDTELSKMLLDPLTSQEGVRLYTQNHTERRPNTGGYLEFPIYFIATKDMFVHLTSDETARNKGDGTEVSTTDTGAKADVINCPRVSFQSEDEDDKIVIWEPNKAAAVAGQTTMDIPKPMQYTDNTRLFHLKQMEPKRVTVRLWVEGEDPQCDDDVQDANLKVQLCFMGTDENNEAVT